MYEVINEHWHIERDEDGDYHLKHRAMNHYLYFENEEMRSLLEGVYAVLLQIPEDGPTEIDGVTR